MCQTNPALVSLHGKLPTWWQYLQDHVTHLCVWITMPKYFKLQHKHIAVFTRDTCTTAVYKLTLVGHMSRSHSCVGCTYWLKRNFYKLVAPTSIDQHTQTHTHSHTHWDSLTVTKNTVKPSQLCFRQPVTHTALPSTAVSNGKAYM